MTITATNAASYIADTARNSLGYGEMLLKDIPADKFDFSPAANMNHPAFCIGHLSIYPNWVLEMIGQP